MKLNCLKNEFSLTAKTEFKDENGKVLYWSIYDFAYKNRTRIFDTQDNELAYVQYKVLSEKNEIGMFAKNDVQVAYIDLEHIDEIKPFGYKVEGDIKNYNFVVKDNDKVLMDVTCVNDNMQINIIDDLETINCLMYMFGVIGSI